MTSDDRLDRIEQQLFQLHQLVTNRFDELRVEISRLQVNVASLTTRLSQVEQTQQHSKWDNFLKALLALSLSLLTFVSTLVILHSHFAIP